MDTVKQVIEKVYNQNLREGKLPNFAHQKQILAEIKAQAIVELQLLVDDKIVFKGDTANDKYYSLIPITEMPKVAEEAVISNKPKVEVEQGSLFG